MSVFENRGSSKMNTHEITVRVRFNKPVSRAVAQRAFKNAACDQEIYASIDEEMQDGWSKANVAKTCKAK